MLVWSGNRTPKFLYNFLGMRECSLGLFVALPNFVHGSLWRRVLLGCASVLVPSIPRWWSIIFVFWGSSLLWYPYACCTVQHIFWSVCQCKHSFSTEVQLVFQPKLRASTSWFPAANSVQRHGCGGQSALDIAEWWQWQLQNEIEWAKARSIRSVAAPKHLYTAYCHEKTSLPGYRQ